MFSIIDKIFYAAKNIKNNKQSTYSRQFIQNINLIKGLILICKTFISVIIFTFNIVIFYLS